MNYLLDVNVLVAWGWMDHADHPRVASWIGTMKSRRGVVLLTSAIPELGFVRVSVQRSAGHLPVGDAARTLAGMLAKLGKHHRFLPDNLSSARPWQPGCSSSSRTTDEHLLALATQHGAQLATLDHSIPGAFLIPLTPVT